MNNMSKSKRVTLEIICTILAFLTALLLLSLANIFIEIFGNPGSLSQYWSQLLLVIGMLFLTDFGYIKITKKLTASSESRPIDRWFSSYSGDHRNDTNQLIHVFAVPAIVWSVIALLWCIPVFGTLFRPGLWAALVMFAAWMFYYRASRKLGYGMLVMFVALAWLTRWLHDTLGTLSLLYLAVAVFVVAWIAQFIGHKIEGKKPSFLTDLTYLLIGPAWVLSKLYRKLGWSY